MAEVLVSFDTNTKGVSVSVDGNSLENVERVYVEKGYMPNGYYCEIVTVSHDEVNDITTRERLTSKQEGVKSKYQGLSLISSKVYEQIRQWFRGPNV